MFTKNGGFFVSRYEIGTKIPRFSSDDDLTKPMSVSGVYPYNFVSCKQAQLISSKFKYDGLTSSLLFGIQRDLVCKFIEENTSLQLSDLKNSSKMWGNYKDSEFEINSGESILDKENQLVGEWKKIENIHVKKENVSELLTTGASKRNCMMNIYDFAGNVYEWTLERNTLMYSQGCSYNGGNFRATSEASASCRFGDDVELFSCGIGFRTSLY